MPKVKYAVFRAPGDWTDAMYDHYDGPELGKKFRDYARRKVGGRGGQAETVFTRKIVAEKPSANVVEVEAGDNEEDAVMAALAAGIAGMGVGAGAPAAGWGGEGMNMGGGSRHRKSRKAGHRRSKSHRRRHSRRHH